MKQLTKAGIAALLLTFMILSISACSDKNVEQVKKEKPENIIKYSGWEFKKYNPAQLESVSSWMGKLAEFHSDKNNIVEWKKIVYPKSAADFVKVISGNEPNNNSYQFAVVHSGGQDRVGLLNADAVLLWENAGTTLNGDLKYSAIPQMSVVDRLSSDEAYYRYEGCFIYNGKEPITELNLRATLLASGTDKKKYSYRGKTKRSTRRSGIPGEIKKGQYFCVKLKSEKMDKDIAKAGIENALGVVEAAWLNAENVPEFAPLFVDPLDWNIYSGEQINLFALVNGAEVKPNKDNSEKIILTDPSLVTLLKRKGRNIWIRTDEGKQGTIEFDNVVALYPRESAKLERKTQILIRKFVEYAAKGDTENAIKLFGDAKNPSRRADLILDIKRRFPQTIDKEFDQINLQWLDKKEIGDLRMISYFIWLKKGHETLWTSFDTVLLKKVNDKDVLINKSF